MASPLSRYKKNHLSLFAINFKNLAEYNPEWGITDVLIFERLLLIRKSSATSKFKVVKKSLAAQFRLSRIALDNSLAFLESLNILFKHCPNSKEIKWWEFNEILLLRNPNVVYAMLEDDLTRAASKVLYYKEFFRYHFNLKHLK
jgi:hypothetical protein